MKRRALENIKIESIGYGGIGIWRLENGKKVLVKGGLPGSIVNGRVTKRKKDYVELQITDVVAMEKAFLDNQAPCPHYLFAYQPSQDLPAYKRGCGGCKRQVISYTKQLLLKHAIVQDSIGKLRDFEADPLPEVLGSPQQLQYRNKIEFSFGTYRDKGESRLQTLETRTRDDVLIVRPEAEEVTRDLGYTEYLTVGFHQQGQFAQVIEVDQCFLIHPQMHATYELLKQDLMNSWLPVYRVKQHTGCLRHLVIRYGFHTGQCMVNLSLASNRFEDHPEDREIRQRLLEKWGQERRYQELITTLVITENNGRADIIQNPDVVTRIARWEGHIFEELHLGEQVLHFQISPFSFFQTNTRGAELLFSKAMEMVGAVKGTILDLYCGSWTIGISFLKAGLWSGLVGIEIVPEAIGDAEKNTQINWLSEHIHFFAGKAEQLVQQNQVASLLQDLDLIIIDPPRQGLHKKVIEFLIDLRRKQRCKLLYISCNPVTFARDVQLLMRSWVRDLQALQPVDMFPQTYHIEIIGVLE